MRLTSWSISIRCFKYSIPISCCYYRNYLVFYFFCMVEPIKIFFFKSSPEDIFIDSRKKRRRWVGVGEEERETSMWEKHWSVASHTHPDWESNPHPGMCPDWESNLWPFSLWDNTATHPATLARANQDFYSGLTYCKAIHWSLQASCLASLLPGREDNGRLWLSCRKPPTTPFWDSSD